MYTHLVMALVKNIYVHSQGRAHDYRGAGAQSQKRAVCARRKKKSAQPYVD